MQIDFKQTQTYDYLQEIDGSIYIHPLFYSAYTFVRKQLTEEFKEDERLKEVETEKEYYSMQFDVESEEYLKHFIRNRIHIRNEKKLIQVKLTPLFFEILKILPKAYHHNLYQQNDGWKSIEFPLEAPISGSPTHNNVDNSSIMTPILSFGRSYQREVFLNDVSFNVDYSYLLLALGNMYEPNISDKEVESVDDYLSKLNYIVTKANSAIEGAEVSSYYFENTLKRATNEGRIALFNKIKTKNKNLTVLLEKESESYRSWSNMKRTRHSRMSNLDSPMRVRTISINPGNSESNLIEVIKEIHESLGLKESFRSRIMNMSYGEREEYNKFVEGVSKMFMDRLTA